MRRASEATPAIARMCHVLAKAGFLKRDLDKEEKSREHVMHTCIQGGDLFLFTHLTVEVSVSFIYLPFALPRKRGRRRLAAQQLFWRAEMQLAPDDSRVAGGAVVTLSV